MKKTQILNEETPEKEEAQTEKKPFENLDLKKATCFGWNKNVELDWYRQVMHVNTVGWKNYEIQNLEAALVKNVDDCYMSLADFHVVDLDDDFRWNAKFDNNRGLWDLKIEDSGAAEIDSTQMADFFGSPFMKKLAERAFQLISRAAREYEKSLQLHLERGDLLKVDEEKLAAILHFTHDTLLMENLRKCVWVS